MTTHTSTSQRILSLITGALAALLLLGGSLSAQSQKTGPMEPAYTFGGSLRLRNEYVNNAASLNDSVPLHEQDYFRWRLLFWMNSQFTPDSSIYLRLAAEPRTWVKDSNAKTHPGKGTEWRYALLDSLYYKWAGLMNENPVTLTVGRQDIQLGEPGQCWLIMDGTPGDGSWTWFFDAARLSLDLKQSKTKVDFVALSQKPYPDSRLELLGRGAGYMVADQNETGFIAYLSNSSIPNTTVDGYYIFKHNSPASSTGMDADVSTLGARVAGKTATGWSYSVEGAAQWGTKADPVVRYPVAHATNRDLRAFGLIARTTYAFNDTRKHTLGFSAELLSGDKVGTGDKDEMFDMLWGRYPRYSEIYAFSHTAETGRANLIGNLRRLGLHWTCSPIKGINLAANYHLLMADEAVSTRTGSPALFSGTGHKRGDLLQVRVTKQFSKQVSAYVLGEFLQQGNYYARRDLLSFIRCELSLSF